MTARADPPAGGWQLLWADGFNGGALDPIKWSTNYPWGPTLNHEAYMSPDHVTVDNGVLNLTATRGIPAGAPSTTVDGTNTFNLRYTSGAVNTSGKLNFTYGYVEARLKMPPTLGVWPAFWMLQHGWPPEIDVEETPFPTLASMSHYNATYHYGVWQNPHYYGSGSLATGADLTAGFHNYGVDWEPDHMTFYFDEHPVYSVTDAAAVAQSANMYLILNLAVGGWPGEPPATANFPATLQADWVRVWQRPPSAMTSTWAHAGSGSWDTDANWGAGAPKLGSMTAVFGTVAAANVRLDWTGSKTIGGLIFQSNTNYVIGGAGESLMLASQTGQSYIDVQGGTGSQSIGSRIELYNNVSIRNYTTVPFTLASGVIGTGLLSLEAGPINLNGALSSTGDVDINNGARVTLNGSIQTPANDLNITSAPGTSGWLTVPNGASATVSTLRVGGYNGGNAVLTQTGGMISANQWFVVGQSQTANGIFNMASGTLNVRAQRGTSGDLEAGVFDNSSGTVNISGAASVRLLNNANIILGSDGTTGTGIFNQNGGAVTFYSDAGATTGGAGSLILGRNRSSGTYTYNLNGGTLTVPSITRLSGTGVFAFNGGTLRAAGDNASFMKGLSAAVVKSGGAFIDTAGHTVTIAQNLLNGGGGLTKNGAGTLTLTGVNAYSGGTTVNAGAFVAAATGALPASKGIINNASFVVTASNSVGSIGGAGTTAVTGGQLDAVSLVQSALSISSGATVRLRAAQSSNSLNSLTITPGGVLDLTNGAILVNYSPGASPLSTIRNYLADGYANGTWTGSGIVTSTADANHTLGYVDTGASVLVQYALVGDANLDGVVDFSDLLAIAQHYGQADATWAEGDFNYDGSVGFDDLLAVAHNIGPAPTTVEMSLFTPAFQSDIRRAFAAVPEPGMPYILALSAGLLPRRRVMHSPVARASRSCERSK